MQSWKKVSLAASLTIMMIACSSNGNQALQDKKKKLEALKKEQAAIVGQIKKLETEIAKLDTSKKNDNVKLVLLDTINPETFTHYIDLQGKVDADNISYISPRGMGGQVRAIYVKEGDFVPKGKLLLKLDDVILRQQVATAKQSMEATKTQIALAKNLYQRQKNLWDQNIGTEVQVLQAKTNVEALENNLKTQQENVRSAQEQLNTTLVYSNVSGVADEVNIHVGETFTGNPTMGIRIVNTSNLKIVTDVPESYLNRVSKGTPVIVSINDINKSFTSVVSLISQSINASSRGFTAEVKIPNAQGLKPNQVATVKIQDYQASNALAVPVNTLQTDEKGKFVLVAVKEGNVLIARKRNIVVGELYGERLEVKSGIQAGDIIIIEGFQNLYDGQTISEAKAG